MKFVPLLFFTIAVLFVLAPAPARAADRPNILWITCEDISPDLGCYGDSYARTPNLDKFATQGVRMLNAFSTYGVCAPSRSSIITGMYPASIGTQHMRSKGVPPPYVKCFTEYLRAAGYYCTNNAKTDYNFDAPLTAWDESSNMAHWRHRAPGQPFFAVFNILTTHESQIRLAPDEFARKTRRLRPEDRHDPAKAPIPPYYPDTPVVRRDWANYCDLITTMDLEFADRLKELEDDGLADNTIVFFFSDHGRGLPRCKRWCYEGSTHIPMMIRWPGKIAPGTVRDDLVSFVDLAPTLLSLAGLKPPAYLQGQPLSLSSPTGERGTKPREYVFVARDRMDEAYDIVRGVRDKRYRYLRNAQAMKPYCQYIDYMEQMPTMKELRRMNKDGTLVGPARLFMLPEKPDEELYDDSVDPHNINNLAKSPQHQNILRRMRAALDKHMKNTRDTGLIPEDELKERMRPGGVWAVTAKPTINVADGKVRMTCATEGASIAYTLDTGKTWKLYVNEFPLPAGATVRAKACRLGYRDSEEVRLTVTG